MNMKFRKGKTAFCATLFCLVGFCLSAEDGFSMSSLIVPKNIEQRNPVTEIYVGFGDVHHLSPWRLKRRFPRNGGARGGQLVTLRDAMLAINEVVAKDEEMPEHTFVIDKDGMLTSICDIPVTHDQGAIDVSFAGTDGKEHNFVLSGKVLDMHIRDFTKIQFVRRGSTTPEHVAPSAGKEKAGGQLLKTGTVKTVTLPGGAKMEMIWCGPGSFLMGSPVTEVGRFEDEPQHKVTLTKGFWLGKDEVTQAQWESVMGSNPSRFKGNKRPVDNVSWVDCQQFIRKANAALDMTLRLPTEAEWEYACRAGSTGAVAGSGNIAEMAWYEVNSGSQTHEVGIHKANAWGFYDMHGNVLEWCNDWFSQPGETVAAAVDPVGPVTGSFRMLRGGCWFYFARDCRSAYRLRRDPDLRNSVFGFRIACSDQ
jgi:formylglycine-generating enzyme required for sulfatase activity